MFAMETYGTTVKDGYGRFVGTTAEVEYGVSPKRYVDSTAEDKYSDSPGLLVLTANKQIICICNSMVCCGIWD